MKTRRRSSSPTVWRRFSRTSGNEEKVLKFKIQDCPEEMYDDLLRFMVRYFMRDETWNKALGIGDDDLAVKEFSAMQAAYFPERLALVCLADDDVHYDMKVNKPKILGFSLMMVVSENEDDPKIQVKSKAITKLLEMFDELDKLKSIFDRYNVKEYLGDAGLSVHPDFRGLGLSKELLLARIDLAKSIGLTVVEATFTSSISQTSAEKCGYETFAEILYHEFEKKTNFKFNTESKSIKMMAHVVK